jgi:hypothetical protein
MVCGPLPQDSVRGLTGRLKQLDHVAGGILQQALRAARPGNDVVAELETGGAQPLRLSRAS